MRQFVLPKNWNGGSDCLIEGNEAHHLLRVLRLGAGDRFPAIDVQGGRHTCEILHVDGGSCKIQVEAGTPAAILHDLRGGPSVEASARPSPPDPKPVVPRIVLAVALLKGEKFDLVIRQATEAGVSLIMPITCSRSLGLAPGDTRRTRQERIIREALQQSGSPIPTILDSCTRLQDLPKRLGTPPGRRVCLLLHETPLVEASLHRYLCGAVDEIVICIGPEGGFSDEEVSFLREKNFLPLRLPGAVLRAETAALYAISAVQIIYAERASWNPETD